MYHALLFISFSIIHVLCKKEYVLQEYAINGILPTILEHFHLNSTSKLYNETSHFILKSSFWLNKSMLCTIFVNAVTIQHNKKRKNHFSKTIHSGSRYCDFAILSYKCNNNSQSIIEKIFHHQQAKLKLFECGKSNIHHHISKPLLYPYILSLLPSYNYIWLLDEDIDIKSLNIHSMYHILFCSFYPRPPPLIFQLTIQENTQLYDLFNTNTWLKYDPTILIAETDFIELQIPIFQSLFLLWFIKYIVQPFIIHYQSQNHVLLAAGFDNLFCKSAAVFSSYLYSIPKYHPQFFPQRKQRQHISLAKHHYKPQRNHNQSNHMLLSKHTSYDDYQLDNYQPCAVITSFNLSIHHLNTKTLQKSIHFYAQSFRQEQYIRRMYPDFKQWSFHRVSNSSYLSINFHRFEKIRQLNNSCEI